MGATAFISMWVSNTATAAMMVPIVLSVVDVAAAQPPRQVARGLAAFPRTTATCATSRCRRSCGVAYGASIGGLGTIIGSPPNGILVRFVEQAGGARITFLDWMLIGVPGDADVPAARVVPQHLRAVPRRR